MIALTAASACACATGASGASIGINFVGGNANGAPTSLDPGDVAGITGFAQGNFNNLTGSSSLNAALVDSTGTPSGITFDFTAAGTWGSGTGTGNANLKLFNGYADGTDNGTNFYAFNNVPAGIYALVIYSLPDNFDSRDEHFVVNGNLATTTYLSAEAGASFVDNGFVRATATTLNGPGSVGNYVQFDNVSPVAGVISFTGTSDNFRNFANAVQLVPVPEPVGLSVAALASSLTLVRRRRRPASAKA
jgi:hypothetical protein